MRHKTSKTALIAAALFFLSLCAIPTLSSADHPYTDKINLKSAVSEIIAAILNEDVDALIELTHLPETFQYNKEDKVKKLLKKYFDKIVETRGINVHSLELINSNEAAAMVSVYRFDRRGGIPGMDLKPRDETWNFVKGKKTPARGKWLFVLK